MNERTQKELNEIRSRFKTGWIDDDDHYERDVSFLLQLVCEQEFQLEKYERIVGAAQYWCETRKGGKWFSEGGNKELINMLKVREAREQALINAVNELTKA